MIVELDKNNKEVISAFPNLKIKVYAGYTYITVKTKAKPKIKLVEG